MKVIRVEASNFGSYCDFSFNYDGLGLSLLYGSTGSGKSTAMDVAAWALFGVTGKGGSADDVKAWQADAPTTAYAFVEAKEGEIRVCRKRGKGAQNDLYWTEGTFSEPIRGKDLTETQKLLESRLGVSKELFLLGAYFHEFSETSGFFTAKAKDRRDLFNHLTDLTLPVKVAEACTAYKKLSKDILSDLNTKTAKLSGRTEQLEASLVDYDAKSKTWEKAKLQYIASLNASVTTFEASKAVAIAAASESVARWEAAKAANIEALVVGLEKVEGQLQDPAKMQADIEKARTAAKCSKCGSLTKAGNEKLFSLLENSTKNNNLHKEFERSRKDLQHLMDETCPYTKQLEDAKALKNTYLEQVEAEKAKVNPFTALESDAIREIVLNTEKLSQLELRRDNEDKRHSALVALYDLSFELRGKLLETAVKDIQNATNRYLEKYFDAELRVEFTLKGGDALEVSIQKSGNEANYRQLSKGQRSLLKLCFSVAVMKAAANTAGVHFGTLFFDEALDGFDAELKVKAFTLFQELEQDHDSILLIDHLPEFQNLFGRRFHVTMEGDVSTITDESQNN